MLACQAGPVNAAPMPMRKVNSRRIDGVTKPRLLKKASPVDTRTVQNWARSKTQRRSQRSATVPARSANSRTGAWVAVCTSATMSGVPASVVISQAAPTPWMTAPVALTR